MNFLAHIYLSFDHPGISIGNFMADGLKRQRLEHFPTDFQKGVMLHRTIDEFTDQHPIFKKVVREFSKYTAIIAGSLSIFFTTIFLPLNGPTTTVYLWKYFPKIFIHF